jgi:excisionase family DNA binding protein
VTHIVRPFFLPRKSIIFVLAPNGGKRACRSGTLTSSDLSKRSSPDAGEMSASSGSLGVGLCASLPRRQRLYSRNLTEIQNSPMILTRPAHWSKLTCGCGTACMREDIAMTVIPMVTRRLLRTRQAAAYLSMSEWKLRRLIQTEIIPFVQDQRGGPFLVDVRDLDAYIEGNKHSISDVHNWESNPVLVSAREATPQPRRAK